MPVYIGIVAVFEYTEDNIAIPTLVLDGNGILGVREIFFSGSVSDGNDLESNPGPAIYRVSLSTAVGRAY